LRWDMPIRGVPIHIANISIQHIGNF